MTRSALTVISLGLLALPSAASGQTFAGGSIGTGSYANNVGTSELGFRVAGSRITVRGTALVRCRAGKTSEVEGIGRGTVAADGTFRVRFGGRHLQPDEPGRFRRTMVVRGRISGGEIVGRLRARASGTAVKRCRGAFDYVARSAPAVGPDPAAPPAGATLVGMTSQRAGGPFALNLRVSPDGRRISQLVAGARYRCRRLLPYQETNYSPAIRIREDGTFRYVERFRMRYRDAVERVRVVTEGRFVAGGATGTWRARTVARSRRTKQVVDRCGTGRQTWSASIL